MKIQYMIEFVSVVENRNFTRAAEECFIAQPSLSKHMMYIEKELGGQLLIRTRHKVETTELGQAVYDDFRKIIKQYEQMLDTVSQMNEGKRGLLRMGVLYYSFERYINDIEMYIEEHCPGIELELVSFQPPQLEKALEHGEVDIAVTLSYDDAPIAGYDKRIFAREGLSAAVSTEHPLAERESISLTDLSGETIVLMRDEPDYNAAVMKLLAANGVEPGAYCYASQVDTTFQEIRKRNGITLFPVQMDYLKKRGVSFVDVEDAGEKIRMAVIFKDSGQTALARTAADAICEMYS